MHQDIFANRKILHLLPGKNLLNRKVFAVLHHLVPLFSHFIIDEIAHQHVQSGFAPRKLIQGGEDFPVGHFIHPVITVYHLEIQSSCFPHPRIHRRTVSAILLMDRSNDAGIILLIFICDLRRTVL